MSITNSITQSSFQLFKSKTKKERPQIFQKIGSILRQWDGKLTKELQLTNSEFGKLPERLLPTKTATTICGFCATGCSLTVHIKDDKPVNLSPTNTYPVNMGKACPKGWEALSPLSAPDRATTPLMKKNGEFVPVDWDTALKEFTQNFKSIQEEHGKESIAFLSTGQIPTEEMALLGSLGKFGMGMLHGDGNTRQCMATPVVAYKESFGFDAPPYTYKDFEESDVLVFIGANPCIAHPIMWERVCMNQNDPKIIVVDPRKTETAMVASHHYPLAPKSDPYLFYGIAKILIENNWIDSEFIQKNTNDFEDFVQFIEDYSLDEISNQTGISKEQISDFAQMIHEGKRVSFWWTMGVNHSHHGVRTAQAIINLALMTGNIGRPGTGANSITGQCNAMGSRLFSNTTNLLGGHSFLNSEHREKIANILEIPEENIPKENSVSYKHIIDKIESGEIKGLWIIGTNPSHSWINLNQLEKAFEKLDYFVVQDMYHSTVTAKNSDLILPAAGWGEKEGTFINSERRIGVIQKVSKAPGVALSDFNIFKLVAEYWGCGDLFKKWENPEKVFQLLKQVSKGTPCDISGITDYKMLEKNGGIQWPFPEGSNLENNERRLFEDNKFFHQDEKAKFIFEEPLPLPEPTSDEYPLTLLSGRGSSVQWHTQTRT
ncbi:MAG: anaerobic selenocysteine-containing dehydrogenase [bacterium]|jgi:anaerobic selenocysteine-containing dehydrogenase